MELLAGVILGLLLIIILSGLYLLWEKDRYLGRLLLSLLLVFGSLYLPKTFYDINELSRVECGWPLPFIEGDSISNPPLPWRTSCLDIFGGNPMDLGAQIDFLWPQFILDIVFGFSLFILGFEIFKRF